MKQIKFLYRQETSSVGEMLAQLSAHFGVDSVVSCKGSVTHLDREDVLIVLLAKPYGENSPGFLLDRLEDVADAGVALALEEGATVIPVLLDDAAMPAHEQLPQQIRMLAFQHAMSVRSDRELPRDVGRLIRDLEVLLRREVGRVFAWDYWLLPFGACLALMGLYLRVMWQVELTAWTYGYDSLSTLEPTRRWLDVGGSLALGGGLVLVAIGICWRRFRLHAAQRAAFSRSGTGSLPPRRSLLEEGCLVLGIGALGWGWWSAAPAAILGMISIGGQRSDNQRRTVTRFVLFGIAAGLAGAVWMIYLQVSLGRFQTALAVCETGQLHLEAEQIEEARLSFQLAIESCPRFGLPYFGLAKAQAQSGYLDQALAEINKALRRYPDTFQGLWDPTHQFVGEAYLFRAQLYDRLDQEDLAEQDRQLASEMNPTLKLFGGMFRFWE